MQLSNIKGLSNDRLAFGLKELAELTGVSKEFLRLEIKRGKLKSKKLGRRIVIVSEEVNRYLQNV